MTPDSTNQRIPRPLEHALLELVSQGGDKASWRWLATHLPRYVVPTTLDMLGALKALQGRGLLERHELDNGMDRWSLTGAGRFRLVQLQIGRELPTQGPLTGEELRQMMTALKAGAEQAIRAFIPHASDGAHMVAVLQQVLDADESLAERVAFGGAMLPNHERAAFARDLLNDSRPAVRCAVFTSRHAKRMDVPGHAVRTLPEAEWDALLRVGLRDSHASVRCAAAALTFASDRGAAVEGEVLANLRRAKGAERHFSLLSLSAAASAASRDVLTQVAQDDDPQAPTAVRALAARPDGHERLLAALHDERPDVLAAALFALGQVVAELTPSAAASLAADPRPEVASALRAYEERTNRRTEPTR